MSDDGTNLQDALDQLIIDLLLEAQNSKYDTATQDRILDNAIAIRRRKVRLESLEFSSNTAGYSIAEAGLKTVTSTIHTSIGRIDNTVSFLGDLAKLAAALDSLIGAAKPLV